MYTSTDDGMGDAALEKTKRQRADPGSDIEQRSAQGSCLLEALLEQARCGPRPVRAVAHQFVGRFLFVELLIRCAFERRATGSHRPYHRASIRAGFEIGAIHAGNLP